ncbi:hypothetical protein [Paracoccus hibiscisoli]|uniref:Uncharacterized protein n=1 Tax=Paracoccus hibiscisoli TaxID=2023261 RepID=A0A4U0R1C7_9RHOB|nr:hypothetical protein [Paracoccus hibiscisoli]TJZ82034.1 hypothetical protein FA740_15395 [Paracoccus hibiscisoli]
MHMLPSQLAHAYLSAAIAITLISTSAAAAGGSGSLFSSETGIGEALAVTNDYSEPEPTDPSLLLYATGTREKPSAPAEEEIWIDPDDYDDMLSYNPDTGL